MSTKLRKAEAHGGAEESYATPKWVVDRLFDAIGFMLPRSGRWLEPAVGDWAIVDAIERRTSSAIDWTCMDIRGTSRSDFVGDFLDLAAVRFSNPTDRQWTFDAAITNPPFSLAEPFARRMIAIAPLAILLLPLPWLGGSERAPFFQEHPPAAIYLIPDRIQFIDPTIKTDCPRCNGSFGSDDCPRCKGKRSVSASSPSVDHAWYVWNAFHTGPTTIQRLAPTPLGERQWWRTTKEAAE